MKFYDTCSLLKKVDNLFDEEEFAISSITLNELEGIKTSATKDPDVKFAARKILHLLDENPEKYQVVLYYTYMIDSFPNFDVTNDLKILATAIDFTKTDKNLIFVTNDLALKNIAGLYFDKDHLQSVNEDYIDDYSGYLEVKMSNDLMSEFYSNPYDNMFDLNINEYLIVRNENNDIVDTLVWTGD